ncbi:MAG: S41 family peptidase [Bacteroidota bacterium]
MRRKLYLLGTLTCLFACSEEDTAEFENVQVFQEMWTYIDENYIYFEHKGINWNEVRADYAPMINESLSEIALLDIMSEMMNTLKDGHNFINIPGTQRSYNFKEGFEIHFDLSVVKNNYLGNEFQELGFYTYGILNDQIAYIHLGEFSGVNQVHQVMQFFENTGINGIILDIRNNPGGSGQDAVEIVGHFIEQPTTVGYLVEKIGRPHDAISAPLSIQATPEAPYFDVPVILLINRGSFSAATYLAAELKSLPNVTLLGQITGGGGGGNQTQELSNGWLVTISSSKMLGVNFDESIEDGIAPDIAIANDSLVLATGIDEMLERAVQEF